MSALAERDPRHDLIEQVRDPKFQEQLKLALPQNVSIDRFTRAAVTALLTAPELIEADRASLFQAIIQCAQNGLAPDGRQAAIVVFNTKVKTDRGEQWVKNAQAITMIGGLRDIAAEHGWTIRTAVVYANDTFSYELGLHPSLTHVPPRLGGERGEMVGAYAVGVHRSGAHEFEVLTADDIAKVRKVSRAANRGPWVDWTEQMAEKTAGRRLFKKLPLDSADKRIARVIEASALEPGAPAQILYGPGAPAAPALPSPATPSPAGDDSQQAGEGDPPPSPAPGPEPEPEYEFRMPAAVVLADEAARFVLPGGKYGSDPSATGWLGARTLAEILAEENPGYLKWALRNVQDETARQAVEHFCRVYAPELFHAAMAERELS